MARNVSEAGNAALQKWLGAGAAAERGGGASVSNRANLSNKELATAVRWTLQLLTQRAPGRTIEVRVPPWGAVQCGDGPSHTRGTPPNVIETDPDTWLHLATGKLDWSQAVAQGAVHASGSRADLSQWLPLVTGTVVS